ncbi:MAG TPA: LysR family transcriptional regulator [Spirochaetota bacterium]|nr:LysR family transcriptional regulator [Spirochaetota bacterium]
MNFKDFNFDLRQLKSFIEVVNEKSFTNASRNLKVSQASISHQIGQLEKMLGVKLIHRTSQDFSLTPEGKVFNRFCEKIMKDINSLKSDMKAGTFGGVVNIVSSSIPGTYIVPQLISSYMNDKNDIFFRVEILNSRETIERVKQGEADLGITGKELKHPTLNFKEFLKDEIVFVGHPDFKDVNTPDELRKIPLVSRESGSGTKNITESHLHDCGIIPSELNIVMECSSSEGVREAIINRIGYGFISRIAIERDLKLGKVKIIKIKNLNIERNFYIVTSKAKILTEPASQFVKMITDKIITD